MNQKFNYTTSQRALQTIIVTSGVLVLFFSLLLIAIPSPLVFGWMMFSAGMLLGSGITMIILFQNVDKK